MQLLKRDTVEVSHFRQVLIFCFRIQKRALWFQVPIEYPKQRYMDWDQVEMRGPDRAGQVALLSSQAERRPSVLYKQIIDVMQIDIQPVLPIAGHRILEFLRASVDRLSQAEGPVFPPGDTLARADGLRQAGADRLFQRRSDVRRGFIERRLRRSGNRGR